MRIIPKHEFFANANYVRLDNNAGVDKLVSNSLASRNVPTTSVFSPALPHFLTTSETFSGFVANHPLREQILKSECLSSSDVDTMADFFHHADNLTHSVLLFEETGIPATCPLEGDLMDGVWLRDVANQLEAIALCGQPELAKKGFIEVLSHIDREHRDSIIENFLSVPQEEAVALFNNPSSDPKVMDKMLHIKYSLSKDGSLKKFPGTWGHAQVDAISRVIDALIRLHKTDNGSGQPLIDIVEVIEEIHEKNNLQPPQKEESIVSLMVNFLISIGYLDNKVGDISQWEGKHDFSRKVRTSSLSQALSAVQSFRDLVYGNGLHGDTIGFLSQQYGGNRKLDQSYLDEQIQLGKEHLAELVTLDGDSAVEYRYDQLLASGGSVTACREWDMGMLFGLTTRNILTDEQELGVLKTLTDRGVMGNFGFHRYHGDGHQLGGSTENGKQAQWTLGDITATEFHARKYLETHDENHIVALNIYLRRMAAQVPEEDFVSVHHGEVIEGQKLQVVESYRFMSDGNGGGEAYRPGVTLFWAQTRHTNAMRLARAAYKVHNELKP